ncbi:hypothetical protein [Acidiphilium sp.]|uniref:hypothetical protein n=1 Tax=Acidiphilium sp. TaxID=527 RepID=UPI003D06CEE1
MQIAAADRGEQLLQRHPAAFLDAVSTVAALGHQVRQLQQQVAAMQHRHPIESNGDTVDLSLPGNDSAAFTRLLQALRPVLWAGATVRLCVRCQSATADNLEMATTAAAWLRGHDFTDVKIKADTASPTITVSARLAA